MLLLKLAALFLIIYAVLLGIAAFLFRDLEGLEIDLDDEDETYWGHTGYHL